MSGKINAIASMAGAAMLAAGSVVPMPEAKADPGFYNEAQVQLVRNGRNDNWRWRRGNWRRGDNDNWVGPAIGGFAAGAIVGSVLTRPRYVAPRARYAYTNRDAYCAQRYRSYDPISNTYVGYDGFRHPCP